MVNFVEILKTKLSRAGKLRRALLQEGLDAFFEITRSSSLALRLTFEIQLLLVRVMRALPIKPPNQAERDSRAIGQFARHLERFRHQVRIVEDPRNETPFESLFRRQLFPEQR